METLFGLPVKSLTYLAGGLNNRVSLLNDTYIVKEYFQHPSDPRKRLDTEYTFLSFAWGKGLRQIPKPLMRDATKALYTKVPGSLAKEASPQIIKQALAFYLELNEQQETGLFLSPAAEAALSPQTALNAIQHRLNRLSAVLPAFAHKLQNLYEACIPILQNPEIPLSQKSLRLSPSDFGLHNILVDQSKAYFLDFEYAGWDDPAKTICDFFTSPRVEIPKDLFREFANAIAKTLPDPDDFFTRLHLHYPLSQLKWCCVILNLFLKTDEERRKFAKSESTLENQLKKATQYIGNFSMDVPNGLR